MRNHSRAFASAETPPWDTGVSTVPTFDGTRSGPTKAGSVLLIDYVGKDHTPEGRRKVVSQEFCDIDSLRRFYRKKDLAEQAALRVIHV
jgi:hypothetical protein